jgi:hypothetical protein
VNFVDLDVAHLDHTHFVGESGSRFPAGRIARGNLLEHLVNLFQRKTLGFGHEEVGIDGRECAQRTPDEKDLGSKVALVLADHVRGDGSDDGVPQPVGSGRKTDSTRTDGKREDFANQHPSAGAPSRGEEGDGQADESDLSLGRGLVIDRGGGTEDCSEELANQHSNATPDEKRAAAKALDSPERNWSRQNVDKGGDETNEERVGDGALHISLACASGTKDIHGKNSRAAGRRWYRRRR